MSDSLIQIVDEKDNIIGSSTQKKAHKAGQIHRIARVMLYDGEGNILLQKRSPNVHFSNLWDHSAAGHVDEGEDYLTAAKREMFEEIGVKGIKLEEIDYYFSNEKLKDLILKRFNKLYKGQINFTPTKLSKDEITEVKWFNLEDLKQKIKNEPTSFTGSLIYVIKKYY